MKAACPICSSEKNREVYYDNNAPLFQNKTYLSKEEAIAIDKGSIHLYFCEDCGFVWNLTFEPFRLNYNSDYQNEQSYSSIFLNHLMKVRAKIMSKTSPGSNIVEIGCGKGTFLELLNKTGKYDICGYDPAYEGESEFIKKCYYPPDGEYNQADLFIMRHVLEHVPDPLTFIKNIFEANDNKGMMYIEVPDFDWIVKKSAFWDISYEHCNYFSLPSLKLMFSPLDLGYLFGDQYLFIIGSPDFKVNKINNYEMQRDNFSSLTDNLTFCREFLEGLSNVAVWGAAAKGANFVRIIDPECRKIKYAVDINPKKQEKYIGGSGHKIISPEKLQKMKDIENIIIMNENYAEEIMEIMNHWDGDFYLLDKKFKKI